VPLDAERGLADRVIAHHYKFIQESPIKWGFLCI
jgi:hypothetical protein